MYLKKYSMAIDQKVGNWPTFLKVKTPTKIKGFHYLQWLFFFIMIKRYSYM